jgi:hypothetical protein
MPCPTQRVTQLPGLWLWHQLLLCVLSTCGMCCCLDHRYLPTHLPSTATP